MKPASCRDRPHEHSDVSGSWGILGAVLASYAACLGSDPAHEAVAPGDPLAWIIAIGFRCLLLAVAVAINVAQWRGEGKSWSWADLASPLAWSRVSVIITLFALGSVLLPLTSAISQHEPFCL